MIQLQELRIGSLLDVDGNIIKVGKIDENFISWNIAKDTAKFKFWNPFLPISDKRINPIPLTEEILLKLGFNEVEGERWCDMHEEFEECNYYYLSMFKIYYNPETDKFEDDSLYHFNVNLKYVHQLQNLYFALTGEELQF